MDTVLLEYRPPLAFITLNRPEKLNAMSLEMIESLSRAVDEVSRRGDIKVAIVRGAGRAFSAGHDLEELLQGPEVVERVFLSCYRLMKAIRESPKIFIAQVHGYAVAGGCQLVAACDMAVASEDAKFGLVGINLGLFCFTPTVFVSRCIPLKRVVEAAFTGRLIDAREALEWGLVNRVVPRERLEEETLALANEVAKHDAKALAAGKEFIYRQLEMPLDHAAHYAAKTIALHALFTEVQSSIRRFLESRKRSRQG